MKRYGMCILLSLIMITTAISGCVGEDENALVGEWYMAKYNDGENYIEKIFMFNSDGTILGDVDTETNEYRETGNWSINDDGTIFNIQWDGSNEDESISLWFVIDGEWLFYTPEQYSNCEVLTKNADIDADSWSSTIEALTYPSLCDLNEPE